MSVSILCLLFNIISLSICKDTTFYIKPTSDLGDCPSAYQPCLTLDQFATYELQTKPEKITLSSFTLILLPGNHTSCIRLDFVSIDSVTMIGVNSFDFNLENPQVVIDLLCHDVLIYSDFSISYLAVNGKGKFSVIMRGVDEMSITLLQIKLVTSAMLINSGYDMSVNISRVLFKASKINVNSTFAARISITDSIFFSGNQLQTMAICHRGLHHAINLKLFHFLQVIVDNVTVLDLPRSDTFLEPPGRDSSFCNMNESRLDTSSDFALFLQPSDKVYLRITYVSLSITNSNFIHNQKNSTAIILELLQMSYIRIADTIISGYTQGAIVSLNHWTSINFTLQNATIKGNSLSHPVMDDLEMNAGAGLTIYNFIHKLPIPMRYEISGCVFQDNVDNQEKSETILIHGMHHILIRDSVFINNYGTSISAHDSKFFLSGAVEFENNFATIGGALALYASMLELSTETNVCFYNNSASKFGGAIYVENPSFDFVTNINKPCFYQLSMPHVDPSNIHIHFENNTATEGGDNIYGAQISGKCMVNAIEHNVKSIFTFIPNNTLSMVSSRATRICICDLYGHPQCAEKSKIFVSDFTIYPGEILSINATTVGAGLGTTTGNVYAKVMKSLSGSHTGRLGEPHYAVQQVRSKDHCTTLKYSIYSQSKYEVLYLVSTNASYRREYKDYYHSSVDTAIEEYKKDDMISTVLLTTPIFINITLKDCPLGFDMMGDSPYTYCDCYTELLDYNIHCTFQDGVGQMIHEGNKWVGIDKNKIIFNHNCLFEYCKQEVVTVKMEGTNESDSQCAFNHAGVLCGGCKEGYSLDLGSTHCLDCLGSSKYAALIAFIFGGLILVGIILLLDLQIENGGINGLIFYANIVWAYRSLVFPHAVSNVNDGLLKVIKYFFQIFIATLNLDIGFQTCFWDGMDAFSKSILQFAFPVYIWIIAGVTMVVVKYFSCCVQCIQKCAKCKCAHRPVEVLVTLILMSYAKLIRTILGVFTFSVLNVYPGNTTRVVWGLDGNVPYLKGKHAVLFVIALLAVFVALIYSIYISIVGLKDCLLKDDKHQIHKKCRKVLDMPLPLYNAHFASFKKKHKYWLGLLLFVRAFLLVIFSSTVGISPVVNLPILILVTTFLLFWMGWKEIYERKSVWALQGLSLGNLIALSGGVLYAELANKQMLKSILICISIGVAFLQFAGILVQSIVQYSKLAYRKCTNHSGNIETTNEQIEQDQDAIDTDEWRKPLLGSDDETESEGQQQNRII